MDDNYENISLPTFKLVAIAFAEWTDWSKYERFAGYENLWYTKKATYSKPIPIKTTEDLWDEFVKHYPTSIIQTKTSQS